MFGSIGVPELLVILAIALLIFGPKKLPEVGRSIGRALREFRKTSDEIKGKIEDEIQAEEFKEIQKDIDNIGKSDFSSDPYRETAPEPEEKASPKDKKPGENDPLNKNHKQETKSHEEGKKKP